MDLLYSIISLNFFFHLQIFIPTLLSLFFSAVFLFCLPLAPCLLPLYTISMDFSAISHRNLHHAYFLEGDHELIIPQLLLYIEKEGIAKKESISVSTIPVFYIENSREVRSEQQMIRDGRKIIIIAFDRIMDAAQQALLKTIEEPTEGTHFFFISWFSLGV